MKMSDNLATTLENFQQACVGFTGPYNDNHDRLCKLAYAPGAEITQEDLDWVKELVANLTSEVETLAGEIDSALDMFDEDVEEVENTCEHDEDPDYCETCNADEEEDA